MNTNPKISILVPVYKVEAYLQRCIDSVLVQDFQDWEMILVDDGSPDRSPEICDEIAQKEERITVVHKKNGGLPSARLAGFERARGEYVIFLDGDDYLLPHALKRLQNIITNGYDIVKSPIWRTDKNGNGEEAKYKKDRGEIHDTSDYCLALLKDDIAPYLHSAIYRRSLFDNSVFEQIIKGNISVAEDWIANILIAPRVKHVYFDDSPTYAYAKNEDSMMSTRVRSQAYQDRFDVVWLPVISVMPDHVKQVADKINLIKRIRFFFVPELRFSDEDYNRISSELDSIPKEIKDIIPKKYLYFIKYKYIYYVYTRLYCLAYKHRKLSGKNRDILY